VREGLPCGTKLPLDHWEPKPGIKPKAPGHRLPARRTEGAPLIVGMPLA
jgi:hypothetical protein